VKEDIKHLTEKDLVVVWGGTKNVRKKYAANGLSQLKEAVRENSNTNIIQI
jgi:hypothetical protein